MVIRNSQHIGSAEACFMSEACLLSIPGITTPDSYNYGTGH
jgi:hypothetical protein